MTDPIDTFKIEAAECLHTLEEAMLELEETPSDTELIAKAFRAMHTIKGSGGMFGFQALAEFTHHLETVFDMVRNGDFEITPDMISVVLDSKDHIETLLSEVEPSQIDLVVGQNILKRLRDCVPEGLINIDATVSSDTPAPQKHQVSESDTIAYRIKIYPNKSSFADGFDLLPIMNELHSLGECAVTTYVDDVPLIESLKPEECYFHLNIVLVSQVNQKEISDVFIFVQDDWKIDIQVVEAEDELQIGSLLVERGDVSAKQIEDVLAKRAKTGEILTDAGLVSAELVDAALKEQKVIRDVSQSKKQKEQDSTVRVPSSKLDALMDLVGELVIVQARMNQLANHSADEELANISEELDRLTTNLRDNTFDIRMLPIGTTFGRFRRLVRDLSKDLGKEIKIVTEGAETEIDKMVIDALSDPMVHLIRNSIDHGIELPAEREQKGKHRQGTIHLSARHQESNIIIEIADDGNGMDAAKLRSIAIQKGLIGSDDTLSEEECYNLIFQPGFSSAKEVTDISGRGVGMDVVRRSIESLRGEVTVSSELGKGSKVTIRLPMTLAIIEGLMVAVSNERYVLPLSCVEECIELNASGKTGNDEGNSAHLIDIRGELVPYVRLREWYKVPGESPMIEQIVVVHLGELRFGFCVDEVIGQYQTVIKSLGKLYPTDKGLAGATIMGNGGVAMIIDVNHLVQDIQAQNTKIYA